MTAQMAGTICGHPL